MMHPTPLVLSPEDEHFHCVHEILSKIANSDCDAIRKTFMIEDAYLQEQILAQVYSPATSPSYGASECSKSSFDDVRSTTSDSNHSWASLNSDNFAGSSVSSRGSSQSFDADKLPHAVEFSALRKDEDGKARAPGALRSEIAFLCFKELPNPLTLTQHLIAPIEKIFQILGTWDQTWTKQFEQTGSRNAARDSHTKICDQLLKFTQDLSAIWRYLRGLYKMLNPGYSELPCMENTNQQNPQVGTQNTLTVGTLRGSAVEIVTDLIKCIKIITQFENPDTPDVTAPPSVKINTLHKLILTTMNKIDDLKVSCTWMNDIVSSEFEKYCDKISPRSSSDAEKLSNAAELLARQNKDKNGKAHAPGALLSANLPIFLAIAKLPDAQTLQLNLISPIVKISEILGKWNETWTNQLSQPDGKYVARNYQNWQDEPTTSNRIQIFGVYLQMDKQIEKFKEDLVILWRYLRCSYISITPRDTIPPCMEQDDKKITPTTDMLQVNAEAIHSDLIQCIKNMVKLQLLCTSHGDAQTEAKEEIDTLRVSMLKTLLKIDHLRICCIGMEAIVTSKYNNYKGKMDSLSE